MPKDESNLMMDKIWIKSKRRTIENCYFFAMAISLICFLILIIGKMFIDVEMDDQTAEYAEYAEFAEYAEYTEYAEYGYAKI